MPFHSLEMPQKGGSMEYQHVKASWGSRAPIIRNMFQMLKKTFLTLYSIYIYVNSWVLESKSIVFNIMPFDNAIDFHCKRLKLHAPFDNALLLHCN